MSFKSVIFSALISSWVLCISAVAAMTETRLVMVEEQGCIWCARWNEEISATYPKTPEGKAAPLLRMDIRAPRPEGLKFTRSLHFTPTFVLMVDGVETSRIEGYPGEDFFWGLLNQMLTRADVELIN